MGGDPSHKGVAAVGAPPRKNWREKEMGTAPRGGGHKGHHVPPGAAPTRGGCFGGGGVRKGGGGGWGSGLGRALGFCRWRRGDKWGQMGMERRRWIGDKMAALEWGTKWGTKW